MIVCVSRDCWVLYVEWLKDFEHEIQSLYNTCIFYVDSQIHTQP